MPCKDFVKIDALLQIIVDLEISLNRSLCAFMTFFKANQRLVHDRTVTGTPVKALMKVKKLIGKIIMY